MPVIAWSGYTVVCTGQDGWIDGGRHGLFVAGARVLSRHRLTVDGQRPELSDSDQPEADRWLAVLHLPRPGGDAHGPVLPQDTLEIDVDRRIGHGLTDRFTVRNRSAVDWNATVELELEADFADIDDLGGGQVRGSTRRSWNAMARTLRFEFEARHDGRKLRRAVRIRIEGAAPEEADDGRIRFPLRLGPGGEAIVDLEVESQVDGWWRGPTAEGDRRARQRSGWRRVRPTVEASNDLGRVLERASDDLFDLRNWELEDEYVAGSKGSSWVVNAGVPTYTGFFGRDTLTAGWQSALVGPRIARGALAVAAATQAETDDPWRDEEPGKLIHEIRAGPRSVLGFDPFDRYYGTQTTASMFVLALSELWHWTGDEDVLRRYRGTALRALEWAERFGDPDGDGFLEYRRRSKGGLKNHGWKDSDEAIRYPDGRLVENPIATVEEQAFHFIALQRMAEILVVLGDDERAEAFRRRAADLGRRWHEAFWMPDERYYALALDRDKGQVRSITSNPGHALAAGIVPPEHAADVADRLLSPELFSGWGVRTLSTRHPSFNPFAYHLGVVWPVEQATFALGMKRYGLDDQAGRLAVAVLEAAAACPSGRLPEALTGHDRAAFPRPLRYPAANSPQAWSTSATVQLVQAMLGIYPFAPLRLLALVRPRLPESLPELTLRRLRVGRASVDLRFRRRADGSAAVSVLRRRGRLVVVPAGPPQAPLDRLSPTERLSRLALDHAPGRLARVARIALGRPG